MSYPSGVHPLPFSADLGAGETTLYPLAIELDAGVLLIDVGLPHTVDTVLDRLADAGFSPEDVRMVVLTHQDIDHAAGLARVVEAADPIVIAHEGDSPAIDGREMPRVVPGGERYPAVLVDIEAREGLVINTQLGPARVVETPGHTPGHISLYFADERFLIAGDALILVGERLYPPKDDFSMDPQRAQESVERLTEFEIEQVHCYHGGFTEQGSERLAELSLTTEFGQ